MTPSRWKSRVTKDKVLLFFSARLVAMSPLRSAQNVKEMQQAAIHLRHPGCGLASQTSKGLDDMLRAVQEAELSSK